MKAGLNSILSEFSTPHEADAYDKWFRAKVEAALVLADQPHAIRLSSDEVLRRMDGLIQTAETQRAARRLA